MISLDGGDLVAKLYLTLCDPLDCSPPGSSVHGIFQTRIMEWVAISFSRGVFPTRGIKPRSPALQVYSFLTEPPGKPNMAKYMNKLPIMLGRN